MNLMPPRDLRLCPALEVALPADSPGHDPSYRPDRTLWEFLFGDGGWHTVTAVAWWTDRHGRPVVQIEWHAASSTWEETYIVDEGRMREAEG